MFNTAQRTLTLWTSAGAKTDPEEKKRAQTEQYSSSIGVTGLDTIKQKAAKFPP